MHSLPCVHVFSPVVVFRLRLGFGFGTHKTLPLDNVKVVKMKNAAGSFFRLRRSL